MDKEKELLLKDLSARLPYGVMCKDLLSKKDITLKGINCLYSKIHARVIFDEDSIIYLSEIKPYLRPMSSMTKEEIKEHRNTMSVVNESFYVESLETFDFYNKHHIDYRNLIGKGLALEASEEIYKL